MSNNVSSKGSDKGAQATGVGIVVVLILPVAIDERQFTASCRLFFPLRAADIRLWEDPFVAHIKHKLDNITALPRFNVCVKVSALRCTLAHRRRLKQVYSWMLAISAQPWHTDTHTRTRSLAISGWDCVICQRRPGSTCLAVFQRSLTWGEKIGSGTRNQTSWLELDWNKPPESKGRARSHCCVRASLLQPGINWRLPDEEPSYFCL